MKDLNIQHSINSIESAIRKAIRGVRQARTDKELFNSIDRLTTALAKLVESYGVYKYSSKSGYYEQMAAGNFRPISK